MKISGRSKGIIVGVAVMVATFSYVVYQTVGTKNNVSYYVTVAEMQKMGDKAYQTNLRVEGFVKPKTIEQSGPNVVFVLTEFESHNPKATASPRSVTVSYQGSEPPPDTFKGDAQALAIGTFGRDGVFHATQLQAKCASKYAPAEPGGMQPGNAPAAQPAAPGSKRA